MLGLLACAAVLGAACLGVRGQREVASLVDLPQPPPVDGVRAAAVALLVFALLLGAGRLGASIVRWLSDRVPARVPRVVAAGLACAAVLALPASIPIGILAVLDREWRATDEAVEPYTRPPAPAERSGSGPSLVSWDSLGREGRTFVTGGPTVGRLAAFSGRPAKEPVRVYVSRRSAPTPQERAAQAVRELERTGAFSRSVLCLAATTGRGLVDEAFAGALEYLHNGDTAVVAVQYSYRPSWLSFLTDRAAATRETRELFTQVYTRWARLPPGARPRLVVFGESLGAYAADSMFDGLDDMRARTDGVLLVGPPHASPNWSELVAGRDPGSAQTRPVVDGGARVRFAGGGTDLADDPQGWTPPRVAYLQNASDPDVWWSPSVLVRRPDWLAHRGDGDMSAAVRWYPLITFAQITADLPGANRPPSGHGHNYRSAAPAAWAAVVPPADWTPQRTRQLSALLAPGG